MNSNDDTWLSVPVSRLIAEGALLVNDGYRAKNSELGAVGLPFARAKNINFGFQLQDADILSEESVNRAGSKISRHGDVVFTSKGTVGRFAFVGPDTPSFVYSPQLCFWRVLDRQRLNPRFLFFWMHGLECRIQFDAAKGQTDMADYISLRDQRTIQISLPRIEEQDRIADVLGALDDKLESNQRLVDRLEAVGGAAFNARFFDFFGVSDFDQSRVGLIPHGWQVRRLSEAVDVNPRVRLKRGTVAPYIGMAALPRWAMRPTSVDVRPYEGGSRFEPGDTLMARITGCIEHGKGALVDFLDRPGSGSTELLVLRAKPPLTPEAVFLLSRAPRVRAHAIASMTGSSGRQRVPAAAFDDLEIAVPPSFEAWKDDAALLSAVFAQTRALWNESRTLMELRNTLLPKLISGAIRVPDTADPGEAIGAVAAGEVVA
jgi:type I restriction enzyme, S subunit